MPDTIEPRDAAQFDFSRVAKCRIHPGIGIARVGNSPNECFIGPEAPCDPRDVAPPPGGYKDAEGRVKRQAARFRIYAYDRAGTNLGELPLRGSDDAANAAKAQVEWKVHLANKKGAWFEFVSRTTFELPAKRKPRNPQIPVPAGGAPDDRAELVIDPGPRCVNGQGDPVKLGDEREKSRFFDTGSFLGTTVPLGELRTDRGGRLLVLGGAGKSGSTKPDHPIGADGGAYYANNNYWHDDIADGPVTALVTLPDGKVIKIDEAADAAWVIVAPPKFAPGILPVVTLYEVICATAVEAGWLTERTNVEYYRDIYPILLRASDTAWVNNNARRGHGYHKLGDYRIWKDGQKINIDNALLPLLAKPPGEVRDPVADDLRKRIFDRIRDPARPAEHATGKYMPQLSGDEGDTVDGKAGTWLSLLPSQYRKFASWKDGNFAEGTPESFPDLADIADPEAQTRALQRAALEPCTGGAFYPGIEMTYVATHRDLYVDAFRINSATHKAGDISKWMALPWQADFYLCRVNWWPSQRPDDVVPVKVFEEIDRAWRPGKDEVPVSEALEGRVKWERGLGSTTLFRRPWQSPVPLPKKIDDPTDAGPRGCDDMVRYWSELGFVVPRLTASGKAYGHKEIVHVETERKPYAGMDIRELFHALLNRETNLGALPKVQEYIDRVLAASRAVQETAEAFNFMDNIRPFPYDEQTFEARMKDIYDDCADFAFVNDADGIREPYDPEKESHNALFRSRAQVTERIVQLTPFNFLDGAWLRNVHRLGPMDEVNSILFAIFNEELGGGVVSQNHANIYRDLCYSFGFYPPPVASSAFAQSPRFLDAAFESATFQLGVAEFTERYYPEIIGVTLWLEWTVLDLHRISAIVERVGLSSHFYRMHIAIDNAENGHAAGILRAVKLYLHQVRQEGGEPAVQAQWRRIWDGYVAFGYTFAILIDQVKRILSDMKEGTKPGKRLAWLEARLATLIEQKKTYAQYNHTRKKLSDRVLNEWFDEPSAFLLALQRGLYQEPGNAPRPFIVPGNPDESAFFKLLEFQGGPMYHVFTDAEIKLWRDWVLELGKPKPPAPSGAEEQSRSLEASVVLADSGRLAGMRSAVSDERLELWTRIVEKDAARVENATRTTPGAAAGPAAAAEEARAASDRRADGIVARYRDWLGWGMIRVVTQMALRGDASVFGTGTTLVDPATGESRTIADWLQQVRTTPNPAEPAKAFLAALAESGSRDGRESLAARAADDASDPLAKAFERVVPGNDGRRARDTMRAWIENGCPLPERIEEKVKPLRLDATLDEEEHHATGVALGFGTMH